MALKLVLPVGFRASGVRCGIKNRRNDLGVILCNADYPAGGVYTTNQFRASCVDYSRETLSNGRLRAIVVNSGNANCATGEQGARNTARMADLVRTHFGIEGAVAVASTGIIGQPLDMTKVEKGIHASPSKLDEDPRPFMDAILTTDLVEKWAQCCWTESGWSEVGNPQNSSAVVSTPQASYFGMCKGSGMISPNMATMLAFVVTDLDLAHLDVSQLLRDATATSFNCLTVDSDTSTNDMLFLIASGASEIRPSYEEALSGLTAVCIDMTKQIARDGEGATKLLEVRVTGTSDPTAVARTIANSPLVKTAMFGCDPNWGRIIAAAGRSGVAMDVGNARLALVIQGEEHLLFLNGEPSHFDPAKVSTALKADHVVIDLRLGEDAKAATIYTCDFGYGYVRINAEYHT
jgi:glutamate N-acetyltransferase / amino-acid N-acetyltransferase